MSETGSTDSEHERLIRQAARLAPVTERLFREAGISSGQRVLDLGSGVGDVAMLVARIVGPSGEVVGVERDVRSISVARARVAEAGLHNVSFTCTDVSHVATNRPFDAAIGRLIRAIVATKNTSGGDSVRLCGAWRERRSFQMAESRTG